MIECETITREWGNSLGVILPKEIVEKEHLKKNEKIKLLILTQKNPLTKTFGIWKGAKSTQQMKDELRRELHQIE